MKTIICLLLVFTTAASLAVPTPAHERRDGSTVSMVSDSSALEAALGGDKSLTCWWLAGAALGASIVSLGLGLGLALLWLAVCVA
jgi:hypothetical protein